MKTIEIKFALLPSRNLRVSLILKEESIVQDQNENRNERFNVSRIEAIFLNMSNLLNRHVSCRR